MRTDGDQPQLARRIRITCAAVRTGFSRFSPAASSSTAASVRGVTCLAGGASAANPPARQARIHRSIVSRDTLTGSPNGPGCAPGGQLPDQPAPLPGGQRRIGGLPDQLVPEQRHLLGPRCPLAVLLSP